MSAILKAAPLLAIALTLLPGCASTRLMVAVDGAPTVQIDHTSFIRRGCREVIVRTPSGQVVAIFRAEDRSLSQEGAAVSILGGAALAGAAGAGIAAAGSALSEALDGDSDADPACVYTGER